MIFRCRSAFKLIEINDRTKLLQPGHTVIDCGAAPGSWTEVAVNATNANGQMKNKPQGFVIGIDRLLIHPIEVKGFIHIYRTLIKRGKQYLLNEISFSILLQGANILSHMDFTDTKTQERIKELLNGRKVDCVLSDMAPNATGVRCLDQDKIMDLCYSVLQFAIQISAEDASLLVKIWDNGNVKKFEEISLRYYKSIKHIKPEASRSDSAEKFLLAKNFSRSINCNK